MWYIAHSNSWGKYLAISMHAILRFHMCQMAWSNNEPLCCLLAFLFLIPTRQSSGLFLNRSLGCFLGVRTCHWKPTYLVRFWWLTQSIRTIQRYCRHVSVNIADDEAALFSMVLCCLYQGICNKFSQSKQGNCWHYEFRWFPEFFSISDTHADGENSGFAFLSKITLTTSTWCSGAFCMS